MRRADVWLPPEEPRCAPSRRCDRATTCARYLAELPRHGARVGDFSIQIMPTLIPLPCVQWRAVERPPASA